MKQCILLPLLLIYFNLNGQNLVGNPGFETFTSPPTTYGQYSRAVGWTNCSGSGTADYYHTSGSAPTAFGPMAPNTGGGQMGFLTRHSTSSVSMEYVCRNLTTPMVIGQNYEVSFFLTRGNGSGLYASATGNIGAYFSTPLPTQPGAGIINVIPQVEQTAVVNVTNAWQQVTFNFTPTASFSSISIGNFNTFAATPFVGSDGRAYYFIDDIVVQPTVILSINELTFNVQKQQERESLVNWHFADVSNIVRVDVQRSSNGVEFETLGYGLNPDTEEWIDDNPYQEDNYYRLRVVDVDGSISYSNVKVVFFEAKPAVTISRIAPNPFQDWIVVDLQNTGQAQPIEIEIYDILGKKVHSEVQQMIHGRLKLELSIQSELAVGTYFLTVSAQSGGRKLHKIIKY